MRLITDKRYRSMRGSVRDAWVQVEALKKSSDYYEKLSEERANEIAKLQEENAKLFDENRKLNSDLVSVQETYHQQTEMLFHIDALRKKTVKERDDLKLQVKAWESKWEDSKNDR